MTAPSLLATLSPDKLARIPKRKNQPEFEHQCALFFWARNPAVVRRFPALALLEGSMNGVKLTKAQAVKAKAAGMLKGSHDVRLPVARGQWLGLSIELKAGDNKPTKEQKEIGVLLASEGWQVHYIYDWEDAKQVIENYLHLPRPNVIARV
jgi:hypothetical protein